MSWDSNSSTISVFYCVHSISMRYLRVRSERNWTCCPCPQGIQSCSFWVQSPDVNKLQKSMKHAAAAVKSPQSCPTLCNPIDGSPPGSPVPGILQASTLEWVGCHFLLQCMKEKSESEVAQSCPTLSDPMDCSPPGSSIHGIFQARVPEWGDICPCIMAGVCCVCKA